MFYLYPSIHCHLSVSDTKCLLWTKESSIRQWETKRHGYLHHFPSRPVPAPSGQGLHVSELGIRTAGCFSVFVITAMRSAAFVELLSCAKDSVVSSNPRNSPVQQVLLCPSHLADEETGAQSTEVTCPRSHSWEVEAELVPGLPDSDVHTSQARVTRGKLSGVLRCPGRCVVLAKDREVACWAAGKEVEKCRPMCTS